MTRVVAPASSANLGPGFDTAAAALDLWNEVTVEPADELVVEVSGEGAEEIPRDRTHLALRAFALLADPDGHRFRFVNRIPLERGLGSSAAAIALGLVAAGGDPSSDDVLAAAAELEGHVDNLAAVLRGGVCLSWTRGGAPHSARIASDLPLRPVLVVPATRTNTAASRNGLPAEVTHRDATETVASAALLGAAIASGDAVLLGVAFHDRLHEQYRAGDAPLLGLLRERLPAGAAGATLSGSGPSVVVWAEPERADSVAAEVRRIVPEDTTVLPLRVAQEGAHVA
jgi:homoserine kinase